jgi:hypothetical protein
LASLSADDFEAIYPHLRTIELSPERSLIELGEVIGRGSIVGASAALGIPVAVTDAIVLP